jgi:hypothetical protein
MRNKLSASAPEASHEGGIALAHATLVARVDLEASGVDDFNPQRAWT